MMKEIQEKRIENELKSIINNDNEINCTYKKIAKDEYYIEITVPRKLIEDSNMHSDVSFLIHMVPNFPFNQPRVYCRTSV